MRSQHKSLLAASRANARAHRAHKAACLSLLPGPRLGAVRVADVATDSEPAASRVDASAQTGPGLPRTYVYEGPSFARLFNPALGSASPAQPLVVPGERHTVARDSEMPHHHATCTDSDPPEHWQEPPYDPCFIPHCARLILPRVLLSLALLNQSTLRS